MSCRRGFTGCAVLAGGIPRPRLNASTFRDCWRVDRWNRPTHRPWRPRSQRRMPIRLTSWRGRKPSSRRTPCPRPRGPCRRPSVRGVTGPWSASLGGMVVSIRWSRPARRRHHDRSSIHSGARACEELPRGPLGSVPPPVFRPVEGVAWGQSQAIPTPGHPSDRFAEMGGTSGIYQDLSGTRESRTLSAKVGRARFPAASFNIQMGSRPSSTFTLRSNSLLWFAVRLTK